MKFTYFFTLFSCVTSFSVNTNKQKYLMYSKKPNVSFKYEGDTPPLGHWDPMQITNNLNQDFIKYLREAEIQHSRIAMVSSLVLPLIDILQPNQLSINFLQNQPIIFQCSLLSLFGLYELKRLNTNYENPKIKLFQLKDNIEPGNYFKINLIEKTDSLNKELNNGRLAMIGTLGYVLQEIVTQQKIFI